MWEQLRKPKNRIFVWLISIAAFLFLIIWMLPDTQEDSTKAVKTYLSKKLNVSERELVLNNVEVGKSVDYKYAMYGSKFGTPYGFTGVLQYNGKKYDINVALRYYGANSELKPTGTWDVVNCDGCPTK